MPFNTKAVINDMNKIPIKYPVTKAESAFELSSIAAANENGRAMNKVVRRRRRNLIIFEDIDKLLFCYFSAIAFVPNKKSRGLFFPFVRITG